MINLENLEAFLALVEADKRGFLPVPVTEWSQEQLATAPIFDGIQHYNYKPWLIRKSRCK